VPLRLDPQRLKPPNPTPASWPGDFSTANSLPEGGTESLAQGPHEEAERANAVDFPAGSHIPPGSVSEGTHKTSATV